MKKSINEALNDYKPRIAELYKHTVNATYKNLSEQFGLTFHGVYNSYSADSYKNLLCPVLTKEIDTNKNKRIERFIDNDKLEIMADLYAEATVCSFKEKILDKLGNVENVEVQRLLNDEFEIIATHGEHKVFLQQRIILKSSSKGLLFNQFPARIYVDGKFISAKKYKEITSKAELDRINN